MTLTSGKIKGMQALSDARGVISDVAMDQRGSLRKALQAAGDKNITDQDMEQFKQDVSEILTPHASGILLDPEFGLPAARHRAPTCGLLLAYEESGYDNTQPGRLPDLLPHESVRRIKAMGADAIKVLIYYNPDEKSDINDIKHAFVERIGAECQGEDIPFFLEFVGYDVDGGDEKGLEYAKKKPRIVLGSMEEFSKPQYGVDVLKVEVPINMKFVEGTPSFTGTAAYSKDQAADYFKQQAQVAGRPYIYLSAGVSNKEFTDTLAFAGSVGARFNGVLCGRAAWLDGVPVYAKEGSEGFRRWLETRGVQNVQTVFSTLESAQAWYSFYNVESPDVLLERGQAAASAEAVSAT